MPINGNALYQYVKLDLESWGLKSPTIEPWLSTQQAAAVNLLNSIVKKFADDVSPNANWLAWKKFQEVNARCESWVLPTDRSICEDTIIGEVKKDLHYFWYRTHEGVTSGLCENPYWLLSEARTGPGASMGALGTDFYTKLFSGPMTYTNPVLYSMYRHYAVKRPLWREAEELRAREFVNYSVDRSDLSFVPKDNTVSRTICTEPLLNMYYQLGLESVLRQRLRAWGIDLEQQPDVNRQMTILGSLTDEFSTIDLSSASDSMSLKMLECLLPRQWYELLLLLRTPKTRHPDGTVVQLHMVSTMGNGTTFPMQTILFSAIVRSVYRIMGICENPQDQLSPSWSVFGDDIIVRREAFRCVCRILTLLGFTVNEKKSFETGPFKESCGVDAFKGADIRGIYLKKVHPSISHYVIFNQLKRWSLLHCIPLPETFTYLIQLGDLRVPPWETDEAGFKFPLSETGQEPKSSGLYHYRKMVVVPTNLTFRENGVGVPRGMKSRVYNSAGHFLAALHGCCTNDKISVRLSQGRSVTYRQRNARVPNWDFCSTWLPIKETTRG